MRFDLDPQELETLIESLDYSRQRVVDAEGTPYQVRRENLTRIETLAAKLRAAREASV